MGYHVTIESNVGDVLKDKQERIERILEKWGEIAQGAAIDIITAEDRVDTDLLRGSIDYLTKPEEETVYVGTNVEYAIYNELGTGIYIEGGRQTPWWYQDREGNWHITKGMKGIHFLKNAIEDNLDVFEAIAESELKD